MRGVAGAQIWFRDKGDRRFVQECSLYGIFIALTFVLGISTDGEGVGGERGLHLRVGEVKHSPVVLDHIDLLYALDAVHSKLLQTILNHNIHTYRSEKSSKVWS